MSLKLIALSVATFFMAFAPAYAGEPKTPDGSPAKTTRGKPQLSQVEINLLESDIMERRRRITATSKKKTALIELRSKIRLALSRGSGEIKLTAAERNAVISFNSPKWVWASRPKRTRKLQYVGERLLNYYDGYLGVSIDKLNETIRAEKRAIGDNEDKLYEAKIKRDPFAPEDVESVISGREKAAAERQKELNWIEKLKVLSEKWAREASIREQAAAKKAAGNADTEKKKGSASDIKKAALPKGMTPGNISCLKKCRRSHERYSREVHLAISESARAVKESAAQLNKAVASQRQKYRGQIVQCSAYMKPIKDQQEKYVEALELIKDKLPAYEALYESEVIDCVMSCDPDPDASWREALPREKLHGIWKNHFDQFQGTPLIAACIGTSMEVR